LHLEGHLSLLVIIHVATIAATDNQQSDHKDQSACYAQALVEAHEIQVLMDSTRIPAINQPDEACQSYASNKSPCESPSVMFIVDNNRKIYDLQSQEEPATGKRKRTIIPAYTEARQAGLPSLGHSK
jgi:hypothetical protein